MTNFPLRLPTCEAQERSSLLDRTWQTALGLEGQSPAERAQRLEALLDEAFAAPASIRRLALEDLIQHLELFPAHRRETLVRAYLDRKTEEDDACGCGPSGSEEADGIRRRLCAMESPAPPREDPAPAPDAMRLVVIVVPDFLSAGSFLQPPIGALLAAARLRRMGLACKVIDNRVAHLDPSGLVAAAQGASLIAVLTTPYDHIQNYFLDYRLRHALMTIDALKAAAPRVPVAVCGAHGSVRPDIVLRDCRADYVVRGEFDTALPSLVAALQSNCEPAPEIVKRGDRMAPVGQDGAVGPFRLVDLDARFRAKRFDDEDLRPAYDLIDLDDYYGDVYEGAFPRRRNRWATILATRGCAYDCTFCFNFWGRSTRRRDPGSVADELAWLERDQRASGCFFVDFNLTENRNWVQAFCAEVRRRGVRLPWFAQTRCDLVDAELLEDMKSAGCGGLWYGIESFDREISTGLDKYDEPEAVERALCATVESGMKPHLFVMIGAPGETRASLNVTIRQMHRWKAAYCGVMPTTPRFGTRLYADAKRQFCELGDDFYSLRGARGLVGNELTPTDLQDALAILNDRRFLDASDAPQLRARSTQTGGTRRA